MVSVVLCFANSIVNRSVVTSLYMSVAIFVGDYRGGFVAEVLAEIGYKTVAILGFFVATSFQQLKVVAILWLQFSSPIYDS